MLQVVGLTVTFGSTRAVDNADLEVPDGSVLALLGPSGCGKSTLLRAIAGLEPPAAGSVRWNSVDLARIPVHRRGFGLMFQDGVLFPHRTVAGNVAFGLRGAPSPDRRVDELLDLVGLAGYGHRRVTTLSGGQAQRVALARALAPRPRLLLLDEPLAALDRSLRESLLADLRAILSATGTTALFVTHDHSEAFAIADSVALMRDGRVVQSGAPRAVWDRPADGWVAEFLGCTAVLSATAGDDGSGNVTSVTVLGARPGSAKQVGLRAGALHCEESGDLTARVLRVVPGVEQQRLAVRVHHPDGSGATDAAAVAPPSRQIATGDEIRLRWNPADTVLIGTEPAESPPLCRAGDSS